MTSASVPEQFRSNASLQASVKEGMCAALMQGTGDSYVSAFAIFMHGTPFQIGVLATLPPFIGAFCQLISLRLMSVVRSRLQLLKIGSLIQGCMWFPLAALPILLEPGQTAVWIQMACITIGFVAASMMGPVWNSLMGDLIAPQERGRYFGYRNQRLSAVSLCALLLGGGLLHLLKQGELTSYGFLTLFLVAGIARLLSVFYWDLHEDPPFKVLAEDQFTFWQFVKRTRESNFVKFVLFVSLFNASVWIAGPYISVYLLRDVQFSYLEFTTLIATTIAVQVFAMQHWGKLSDQFGNKRILNLSAIGMAVCPFLWLVSSSFWFVLMIQILSGFFLSGFALSSANYIFDAVSSTKRARCIAYYAIINSTCVLAGSFLGAYLIRTVPNSVTLSLGLFTPSSALLTVFLASGIARVGMLFVLMPLFKEVRTVEAISHRDLVFRVAHVRPLSGLVFSFLPTETKKRRRSM